MIRLVNICKSYNNVTVLRDINLHIEAQEFVAVTGSSGAGKTTLLNLISTLDGVSSGEIFFEGERIDNIAQSKASNLRLESFGFVFQKYYLIATLNIYDNIVLPVVMNKGKIDKEYFDNLVNWLGIGELLLKMPGELSGGEQQRVAIARALIHKPKVIFADEPTGNLDSTNGKMVFDLLLRCVEKYGQTVVFVTHNEQFASMVQRKIVLKDGEIIEDTKA